MNAPLQPGQLLPVEGALLSYRAQLLKEATPRIPLTNEGLPVGYYRLDLLPQSQPQDSAEVSQALKAAYIDLNYDHGYPTLGDGRPFWHKLDFEPGFEYGAFQIYLEQIDFGPRDIAVLSENTELQGIAKQVHNGSFTINRLNRQLHEASILYGWKHRAKSYDLYKEAAYRHLRLRRQMNTEDHHYGLATKLLKQLQDQILTDGNEKFWKEMSPKTAIEFLAKLVAIQRVSIGLPAAGPLGHKETPMDTTFEMIMRNLGQKQTAGNTFDQSGAQVGGKELLNRVLEDTGTAAQMQELIIRVTQASHDTNNAQNSAGANRFGSQRPGQKRSEHAITPEDLETYNQAERLDPVNLDGPADFDSLSKV